MDHLKIEVGRLSLLKEHENEVKKLWRRLLSPFQNSGEFPICKHRKELSPCLHSAFYALVACDLMAYIRVSTQWRRSLRRQSVMQYSNTNTVIKSLLSSCLEEDTQGDKAKNVRFQYKVDKKLARMLVDKIFERLCCFWRVVSDNAARLKPKAN